MTQRSAVIGDRFPTLALASEPRAHEGAQSNTSCTSCYTQAAQQQ